MNSLSARGDRVPIVTLAAAAIATLLAAPGATADVPAAAVRVAGDPEHGRLVYHACEACHSVDDNDIGPRHRGVVGRRAGSLDDYSYSNALRASGITWDEATLDAWLSNPSALVPGTKMFFRVDDPQSRADVIAFLKAQK